MARAIVNCATEGCEGHFYANGNTRRDADYRARRMAERGWTCHDCDNREAAETAAASGLPELEGSEKQVAWANGLRNEAISRVGQQIAAAATMNNPEDLLGMGMMREQAQLAVYIGTVGRETVDGAFEEMKLQTDARYWIDGRHEAPKDRLAEIVRMLADEAKASSPEGKAAAAAEQEAMAEATMRPPAPVSETIAEISFRDGKLYARYEERSEALNTTLKTLGFTWDPAANAWSRRYQPAMMGEVEDCLAETAHELLAGGFVVALHDPAARTKAVDRTYEPEHRRWVSLVVGGQEAGKFRLLWPRTEDFYREFRGLPGAAYRAGACVVPVTSRDEVLDFAATHGFRLTAGAEARAAEVLEQRERGTVVDAVARPKAEVERRGDAPARLAVPSDVAVDDDLADHD